MIKHIFLIAAMACGHMALGQTSNRFDSTGNAGIGTKTPSQRLEILTNGASNLQLTNNWDVLGAVGAVKFNMAGTEVGAIEAERTVATGRLSALKFFVRSGSGVTGEAMGITQDANVGIGTTTPLARLHITGPQGTPSAKFTVTSVPEADAFLSFENGTNTTGHYIPSIRGRCSAGGRPFGLYLTGEAEDVTPSGIEAFAGAIILDGRSKNASKLNSNNVVMINSFGQNLVAFKADGSVGIGATDTKGYKLAVNGNAIFTKVKVEPFAGWPDYVFEEDYALPSLAVVEKYINEHKHLPDMPSAQEVQKEGLDIGEMNKQLLQKVEELTLYIIQLKKDSEAQKQMIQELQSIIKK
ncbi:hypothetical protein SAMN04488505_11469 [Chitinophaga rupis]|uniref:Uncharacterized protein n=1 Tax=Chitinophaga rupis TaxID=573321 RepID=A0A1H8KAK5_9BACT|nr:hypothetical protein [Chitinophaga rupis]SEN89468.1 hypothetical protein SAMN04488505_11469 [Chitinophaga rupis]